MSKIEKYKAELARKQTRLENYLAMEEKMLTGSTPQAYSIGSRSKTNYSMSLDQLRVAIEKLEKEIRELENLISGKKSLKMRGVVPRF